MQRKIACKGTVYQVACCRSVGGCCCTCIGRGLPSSAYRHFWCKNESVYYTEFAIKAFRIYLCMMILACVNKACFIFLQAVGKALSSTMLSMFREVVFGVGLHCSCLCSSAWTECFIQCLCPIFNLYHLGNYYRENI